MGGQHAKTFLKEEPLHIDLHISLSTFAHPTIPTYLTKLVILDLCYRLKRGHPFSHGLGVSMPRPFRKGIACYPSMYVSPFCGYEICCFIICIRKTHYLDFAYITCFTTSNTAFKQEKFYLVKTSKHYSAFA